MLQVTINSLYFEMLSVYTDNNANWLRNVGYLGIIALQNFADFHELHYGIWQILRRKNGDLGNKFFLYSGTV